MKTALIVVDMVKDFTDPNGLVFYPQNREVLPKIKTVVEYFHETQRLVIYMRHSYRSGKFDRNLVTMRPNCIDGTGGDEIDPMLPILPTDYQIKKRRYSAFFGTDLDLVLRENGVEQVVIVGTKTNCCIRATATDAYYRDYRVIVLSDCVATNSDVVNRVHLEDIQKYIGTVMTWEECRKALEEADV
uniref:cysteine hydrolase family protein n=1 Tax=Ndongobacter massiliensis TaxID=1871025 RepID=UPI0009303413|nr:isochorismatase family cysteine hydrolase [Ndongobacter massiliensis]